MFSSFENQRFLRSQRLKKRNEYLLLQEYGRKIHLERFLVCILKTTGMGRMGITVSRKVGKAVQRNRVKRLIREVWRQNKKLIPLGYDVVFVAKKNTCNLNYWEMLSEFKQLVPKIGV